MEIKFKDSSNTPMGKKMVPLRRISSSQSLSSELLINTYQERPLKINSQNLSFKGFSVSAAVKKFGEEFGESAAKNLEAKINKASSLEKSGLKFQNDTLTFAPDKKLHERFVDLLKYPFVEMPLDFANWGLKGFKKIGINTDNLLNSKALKNRQDLKESASNVASIKKYFGLLEKGEKAFSQAHSRMNPLVANYDSTAEKTATRLVTGAIPAFYLANDAYNLSIYMNNNKEMAKKEKKRRFKQEAARIAITAGATFAVLKLFSKQANASETATIALMSGLTFASEVIGRMITKTPVLPLNEKGAKRYSKLQGKDNNQENKPVVNDIEQEPIKNSHAKDGKNVDKKGQLTLANVLKFVGGMVVFAFGVEKLTGIKSVKSVLEGLNNKYKNLYTKDFTLSRNEFETHIKKLNENGFDKIAQKYNDIVKDQKGETLNLGKVNDKTRYTVIHQVLTFPVRFVWDTIIFPYKGIAKPMFKAISKSFDKMGKKSTAQAAPPKVENKPKSELEILKNSIQFLRKIENKPNFKEQVNNSIMSSLDGETKSNYSNADLNAVLKNTMSAITSGFLIADNYNMVMIDSKGQDKELAEQKAKERTVQRGARIAYGAFLVKFLNGMFMKTFNGSLLGAQAVNALYAVSTETMERKSVGLPLTESTPEKIKEKEQKHLQTKGFIGSYYRFMAKLTGKKAISERDAK